MSQPEGTGSRQDDEDVVLPSWIDAAIAKSKDPDAPDDVAPSPTEVAESEFDEAVAAPPEIGEPAAEPYDDAPDAADDDGGLIADDDFERVPTALGSPAASPSDEFFPSFLDRQRPVVAETSLSEREAVPHEPATTRASLGDERLAIDAFEEKRAAIVSEALADSPASSVPRTEPVPLPTAPRRRGGASPWLMAAIFFAAAAIVLAVLIWLRPLPQ